MTGPAWLPSLLSGVPDAWNNYAETLRYSALHYSAWQYSLGAAVAVASAWLIHKGIAHRSRLATSRAGAGNLWDGFSDNPVPAVLLVPAPIASAQPGSFADRAGLLEFAEVAAGFQPASIAASPSVPQGNDLAARARFVAMRFAPQEPDEEPRNPAADPPSLTKLAPAIAEPALYLAEPALNIGCQPARFTLTLRYAALRYRLQLASRADEALGPLMIRADLTTIEPGISQDCQAAFDPDGLPLCHYLDGLPVGDTIELSGELRLSLASIAAIRLGAAELLMPLLRIWVGTAGDILPALSHSACFAIGVPPAAAGGGIQPLQLVASLATWRNLTARRMEIGVLPQS